MICLACFRLPLAEVALFGDLKTAQKLKEKFKRLGITYDRIATDDWQSFVSTFTETEHDIGKKYTVGIEGRPT
ncbi:MAG: hypothetical protein LBU17_11455 [Treponema sp.]|jgi:IS1 family transposase|nr:hypothetical protein [Treponema sp.]